MCEITSFFRNLRLCSTGELLQHQFAYWVCPVLGNIKPAVLFQIRGEEANVLWRDMAHSMLQAAGLEEARLSETPSQTAVLLYRAPQLEAWLDRRPNRQLLERFGYDPAEALGAKLDRLRARYDIDAFPHEIGVFLGYPACDVDGFIRHAGKNYKLCGHWKVYGDVERSRQVFSSIDDARRRMADMLNHRVPVSRALTMV